MIYFVWGLASLAVVVLFGLNARRRKELEAAERRNQAKRDATITASGVPVAGTTTRGLVQVIEDLVAVRPVNWEDSRDPQQRAAWRAAEAALVQLGRLGGR